MEDRLWTNLLVLECKSARRLRTSWRQILLLRLPSASTWWSPGHGSGAHWSWTRGEPPSSPPRTPSPACPSSSCCTGPPPPSRPPCCRSRWSNAGQWAQKDLTLGLRRKDAWSARHYFGPEKRHRSKLYAAFSSNLFPAFAYIASPRKIEKVTPHTVTKQPAEKWSHCTISQFRMD